MRGRISPGAAEVSEVGSLGGSPLQQASAALRGVVTRVGCVVHGCKGDWESRRTLSSEIELTVRLEGLGVPLLCLL